MPSVYVCQRPPVAKPYDLANAVDWGGLVYLFDNFVDVRSPARVVEQLDAKLSSFTDADHLILLGHPLITAAATSIASDWNDGRVRVLNWDGRLGKYHSLQLDFNT